MSSKNKKKSVSGPEKDPYVDGLIRKGNWARIRELALNGNQAAIAARNRREGASVKVTEKC